MPDLSAPLQLPNNAVISFDMRYTSQFQTSLLDRVALLATPLIRDRWGGRDNVVFAAQPSNTDQTLRLGEADSVIEFDTAHVPDVVEAVALFAFIQPRANAARRTLGELDTLAIVVTNESSHEVLQRGSNLAPYLEPAVAARIGLIERTSDGWKFTQTPQTFEGGLDAALASVGGAL